MLEAAKLSHPHIRIRPRPEPRHNRLHPLLIKPAQIILWRPTFAEPAPPVIRHRDSGSEDAVGVAVLADH